MSADLGWVRPRDRRPVQAAAQRVPLDDRRWIEAYAQRRSSAWQDDAFLYARTVGELKQAMNFVGNQQGRLRWYAATRLEPDSDPIPVDSPDSKVPPALAAAANDLVYRLGSPDEQREMRKNLAFHRDVPGECYLVGLDATDDEAESWSIRSIREVRPMSGRFELFETPEQASGIQLLDASQELTNARQRHAFVQRIWEPDPEYHALPTSPVRGALDVLEELLLLTLDVKAWAKSRLSAPIVLIPEGMTFGPADPTKPASASQFVDQFMRAVTEGINNPDSPSAVVGDVLMGPAEAIQAMKTLDLSRADEPQRAEARKDLIYRLSWMIDLPPETIFGLSSATHWNAAQISKDVYGSHGEPLAQFEAGAMTRAFMHPQLRAQGFTELRDVFLWYDAAAVTLNPNRAQDVKDAHASYAINDRALRRELDLPESDAPSVEFPNSALTAAQAKAANPFGDPAPLDGEPAQTPTTDVVPASGDAPAEVPTPMLAAAPRRSRRIDGRALALADRDLLARLRADLDATLTRGLERAGNRLKAKAQRNPTYRDLLKDVAAVDVTRTAGPAVASALGLSDDELLAGALDDLAAKWDGTVRWGQEQALSLAARVTGKAPAAVIEAKASETERLREAGWQRVHAAAETALHRGLWAGAVLAAGGIDLTDALAALRAGLAEAGGLLSGSGGIGSAHRPALREEGLRGLHTGGLVTDLLAESGIREEGFTWLYGSPDTREHPFESHMNLDLGEFLSADDPRLATTAEDSWIGEFYAVGDHNSCGCNEAPFYVMEDRVPEDLAGDATRILREGAQEAISILAAAALVSPPPKPAPAKGKP